ncbi:MAG TPA: hypothetical protein VIF62_25610, partial [Labilithrix sp.]|jgi:hypothetical protein
VQAYQFQRKNQAIVSGGNPSAVDTSHFLFDVDSGIIMSLVVVTNTSSNFGAEKVSYQFSVAATRTTSSVSPVLVDP